MTFTATLKPSTLFSWLTTQSPLKHGLLSLLALVMMSLPATPAAAEVNVNINVSGPPVIASEPVHMVMVPKTSVYFVPDPGMDIFYYQGAWWSYRGNVWYSAGAYNGPWVVVKTKRVPRAVVAMPPNYRVVYANAAPIPYGQWKKTHYKHSYRRVYVEGGHGHHGEGHHDKKHH